MPAPLSPDLRQRLLKHALAHGAARAARHFDVHHNTVLALLRCFRDTGSIAPKTYRRGPHPTLTDEHRARIEALLADNPSITQAQIAHHLSHDSGRAVSRLMVHAWLKKERLTYKKRPSGRPSSSVTT